MLITSISICSQFVNSGPCRLPRPNEVINFVHFTVFLISHLLIWQTNTVFPSIARSLMLCSVTYNSCSVVNLKERINDGPEQLELWRMIAGDCVCFVSSVFNNSLWQGFFVSGLFMSVWWWLRNASMYVCWDPEMQLNHEKLPPPALRLICEAVPVMRVLPLHKWKCFSNLYIFRGRNQSACVLISCHKVLHDVA